MKITEEQTYRAGVIQMLSDIKDQVVKTNGRVNKLERTVLIIVTFLSGVTVSKLPMVSAFLSSIF